MSSKKTVSVTRSLSHSPAFPVVEVTDLHVRFPSEDGVVHAVLAST